MGLEQGREGLTQDSEQSSLKAIMASCSPGTTAISPGLVAESQISFWNQRGAGRWLAALGAAGEKSVLQSKSETPTRLLKRTAGLMRAFPSLGKNKSSLVYNLRQYFFHSGEYNDDRMRLEEGDNSSACLLKLYPR